MFLQVKEARPAVLERYTGHAKVPHNGQRVVVGQRLMQSASDMFLGWTRGPRGRDFYIRQLRDMKISPAIESATAPMLRGYAALCGVALARAHAKSGDPAQLSGYIGQSDRLDRALADFAIAYAKRKTSSLRRRFLRSPSKAVRSRRAATARAKLRRRDRTAAAVSSRRLVKRAVSFAYCAQQSTSSSRQNGRTTLARMSAMRD